MMNMDQLTLGNLAGGGAQEIFEREIQKVLLNIQDPNTNWKERREITIKVAIHPNEQRTSAALGVSFSTKLAKQHGVGSTMFLQRKPDGSLGAVEYNPEQLTIFEKGQESDRPTKLVTIAR